MRVTGGSITALYTVLADGDDTDDPIVDAARAIVDGHIILSRGLAEQGVYPGDRHRQARCRRVMADIVTPEHAAGRRRLPPALVRLRGESRPDPDGRLCARATIR